MCMPEPANSTGNTKRHARKADCECTKCWVRTLPLYEPTHGPMGLKIGLTRDLLNDKLPEDDVLPVGLRAELFT